MADKDENVLDELEGQCSGVGVVMVSVRGT